MILLRNVEKVQLKPYYTVLCLYERENALNVIPDLEISEKSNILCKFI